MRSEWKNGISFSEADEIFFGAENLVADICLLSSSYETLIVTIFHTLNSKNYNKAFNQDYALILSTKFTESKEIFHKGKQLVCV